MEVEQKRLDTKSEFDIHLWMLLFIYLFVSRLDL